MPYYQGDFYEGDFYQGDPFMGALLGRVARAGWGAAKGLLGMPGGAIVKGSRAAAGVAAVTGAVGTVARRVGGVVAKHPVLSAAGAAGTIGVLGGMGGRRMLGGGAALPMKGFHVSRRTGKLVRNRRMRVTNPKALRRAIRRANGFARLARQVLHFTSPKAPRGRAIFRKKTRKR
jgi:hypothetical protein